MTATLPADSAMPYRQIRAYYDDETITVYQAYNRAIANAAVKEQKLYASPLFKPTRMTWIKPSWAWMLYRAGYSYKDPGQERILALRMRHDDFLGLLKRAVLTFGHSGGKAESEPEPYTPQAAPRERDETTPQPPGSDKETKVGSRKHRDAAAGKSPDVKVQWDPERTVRLEKLEYRSIQIGIPAALSPEWTEKWIVSIEDVTDRAKELKRVLDEEPDVSDVELVKRGLVPAERPFEISEDLQKLLKMIV
ncbi:hypothetical protein C8A05DRAFT_40025 [Staphylotrichum tortipilum]|uniref:ATP-dependent RNA helicase DHX8 n=1 Tax=Staphylotrichum tortipilum TaxID=2831512 RepID=A0AAN6M9I4_9PEZI|nr:hypothetical protein C8A05DRAFT_40025 [Staphylotrichum longicolle]